MGLLKWDRISPSKDTDIHACDIGICEINLIMIPPWQNILDEAIINL